jgi:hypothetical protein
VNRAAPWASPDNPIGRSDGRCVQRAGTKSPWASDPRLLEIPCSQRVVTPDGPRRGGFSQGSPPPYGTGSPGYPTIVARVRPMASKGITDLLLTRLQHLNGVGSPRTAAPAILQPTSLGGPLTGSPRGITTPRSTHGPLRSTGELGGPNNRKTGSRSLAE